MHSNKLQKTQAGKVYIGITSLSVVLVVVGRLPSLSLVVGRLVHHVHGAVGEPDVAEGGQQADDQADPVLQIVPV